MGLRYRQVLRRLGQKFKQADIEWQKTLDTKDVDRVIIATPTDTHYALCKFFAAKGIATLCEKPVEKSYELVDALSKAYGSVRFNVVCNWSYVFDKRLVPESNDVIYNNQISGSDGLIWDCIQLLYLSDNFKCQLKTGVPWSITINGVSVTPKMIEDSYTKMIADWLKHPERLWGMQDVLNQTAKAEKYLKEHP
jgi:hypothetical protein